MEDRKETNVERLSVPQFGDWDQKGNLPDYSTEMRKQNKRDIYRSSIGNKAEPEANYIKRVPHHYHISTDPESPPPITRRSLLSYFKCCIKA